MQGGQQSGASATYALAAAATDKAIALKLLASQDRKGAWAAWVKPALAGGAKDAPLWTKEPQPWVPEPLEQVRGWSAVPCQIGLSFETSSALLTFF